MRGRKQENGASGPREAKKPLDIDRAFHLIRAAIADYPPAAMFELAEDGFHSVFE